MFSNLSSNSISLATVTPSLVIVGPPKDLSSTTLRPLGPRVTFTASANIFTPRSIFARASLPNNTSFEAMLFIPIILFIDTVFKNNAKFIYSLRLYFKLVSSRAKVALLHPCNATLVCPIPQKAQS